MKNAYPSVAKMRHGLGFWVLLKSNALYFFPKLALIFGSLNTLNFCIFFSHLNAKISLETTCDCLSQLENTVSPHYTLLHGQSSN